MAAIPSALRADVDACKLELVAIGGGATPKALCDRLVAMLAKGLAAAETVSYLRDAVPLGADRDRVTDALKPHADAPELADYRAAPAKEAAYRAAETARAQNRKLEAEALLVGAVEAEELEPVRREIAERASSLYWQDAASVLPALEAKQEELVQAKADAIEALEAAAAAEELVQAKADAIEALEAAAAAEEPT